MTTIVAIVGDMHIGSTVGLCTPTCKRDDGDEYRASLGQRWLWECWVEFWESVAELGKAGPVYSIINGDAVELDTKRRSYQRVSQNPATILDLADDVMTYPAAVSERMFFIRGTGAHTGKSAWGEELLGARFDNTEKDGDNASWWSWLGMVENVRFDVQHHGSMGRREATRMNPVHALAVELELDYIELGLPFPHLAIRSHMHHRGDTFDNHLIRTISLPAWQLGTEYVYRIGAKAADIGGIAVICDGKDYEVKKWKFRPLPPKVWVLQTVTCSMS